MWDGSDYGGERGGGGVGVVCLGVGVGEEGVVGGMGRELDDGGRWGLGEVVWVEGRLCELHYELSPEG